MNPTKLFKYLFLSSLIILSKNTFADNSSAGKVRLVILSRGNGSGIITNDNRASEKISCSACETYLEKDEKFTLRARANDGSIFTGWSDTYDLSERDPGWTEPDVLIFLNEPKIIYAKFELTQIPKMEEPKPEDREIPRVSFLWGKVNQHWDLDRGVWETDMDGTSGARENKLDYCRKFYPDTKKVVPHKEEMISSWRDAGNLGQYVVKRISYRCVQKNENVPGKDMSDFPETPDAGSICHYYPDLPLCQPFEKSKENFPDESERFREQ